LSGERKGVPQRQKGKGTVEKGQCGWLLGTQNRPLASISDYKAEGGGGKSQNFWKEDNCRLNTSCNQKELGWKRRRPGKGAYTPRTLAQKGITKTKKLISKLSAEVTRPEKWTRKGELQAKNIEIGKGVALAWGDTRKPSGEKSSRDGVVYKDIINQEPEKVNNKRG